MVRPIIRLLTPRDIPMALDLCRSAGWNQLQGDWARLIDHEPEGCFAATLHDQLVGTITTTRYGTDLAWIGMMLVHEDYRRRGIATDLMNAGLEYLHQHNVRCIKLDATPAGQPVYERLGFRAEWSFRRWVRGDTSPEAIVPNTDDGCLLSQSHLELDRVAFAANRSRLLQSLIAETRCHMLEDGFGMLRMGHLAQYLGPVVADNADTARELVLDLLPHVPAKVFWDPPDVNPYATDLATSLGFEPIRDLTRMSIGSTSVDPLVHLQYALVDPGTG